MSNEMRAISQDIEHVRDSMDQRLDELRSRFSPRSIANRTITNVKEVSNNMYQATIDIVKEHPIPVAIAGAGAAMLIGSVIMDRRRAHNGHHSRIGDAAGSMRESDYTGGVASAFERGKQTSSRAVHTIAERSREVAERAAELGRDTLQQAKHRLKDAEETIEHTFDRHPLLIGAGAFAAGMALGAVLPSTRKEDRLMGKYRDALIDSASERASSAAQATMDEIERQRLNDPMKVVDEVRRSPNEPVAIRDVSEEVGKRSGAVVGTAIEAAAGGTGSKPSKQGPVVP
jgi:ElaB/YqjD/DUF883 family membrane-anchored ribosome-binding protein